METKLDFSDVLIEPTPTEVESRKLVDLEVTYRFAYSPLTLTCVPVMAANMDTVGTLEVMKVLAEYNMFTCLHKFITVEEFALEQDFLKTHLDNFAITIGYSDSEIERLREIQSIVDFKAICIDYLSSYSFMFPF